MRRPSKLPFLDKLSGKGPAVPVAAAVVATAAVGSWATYPNRPWYDTLRRPSFTPPPAVFPIAWTALYAALWASSAATIRDLRAQGRHTRADAYIAALAANLTLNAGWSLVFFGAHRLRAATVVAGLLAVSAADLGRRAAPTGTGRTAALVAYAGWCGFATVLSASIATLNPRRAASASSSS